MAAHRRSRKPPRAGCGPPAVPGGSGSGGARLDAPGPSHCRGPPRFAHREPPPRLRIVVDTPLYPAIHIVNTRPACTPGQKRQPRMARSCPGRTLRRRHHPRQQVRQPVALRSEDEQAPFAATPQASRSQAPPPATCAPLGAPASRRQTGRKARQRTASTARHHRHHPHPLAPPPPAGAWTFSQAKAAASLAPIPGRPEREGLPAHHRRCATRRRKITATGSRHYRPRKLLDTRPKGP